MKLGRLVGPGAAELQGQELQPAGEQPGPSPGQAARAGFGTLQATVDLATGGVPVAWGFAGSLRSDFFFYTGPDQLTRIVIKFIQAGKPESGFRLGPGKFGSDSPKFKFTSYY